MMPLPNRLAECLAGSDLRHVLDPVFRGITEQLQDNQMVFFPGYTKHGAEHVSRLLEDIERLVPESVWEEPGLFTPADAACVTLAAMLHDLAMLLREPGLEMIISGAWPPPGSRVLMEGDRAWPDLWDDFVHEARRFDDSALDEIWGPIPKGVDGSEGRPSVRDLPADSGAWTKYDRLIAGEFLRRHHARLAHEFAIFGMPGVDPEVLPSPAALLRTQLPEHQELADLSGLVARSHGMDLRRACRAVKDRFPKRRRPEGTAPFYLMALLRVADYLQLKGDRAPGVLLQLAQPQSPLSVEEWAKHRAVRDIDWASSDPLSLFIELDGRQLTLSLHLQLEKLFRQIQLEMDTSTAVLREEYGTDPAMSMLCLSRSRLESDLGQQAFLDALPYVPRHTRFSVAGPAIIDLLTTPLYAGRPELAVRELIQNGVDAVREWRRYRENHPDVANAREDGEVAASFERDEDGVWWFHVRDSGIGMSPETVQRCFMRAGMSYRSSVEWKDEFEASPGRSTVLRSGRFGIGAFAAFHLGDEVHVRTRHAGDTQGVRFEASLRQDPVPLRREADAVRGTTVSIRLRADPQRFRRGRAWDFYVFTDVRVRRLFDGEERGQELEFPNPAKRVVAPGWRSFTSEKLRRIDFHYPPPKDDDGFGERQGLVRCCCNGLVVSNSSQSRVQRPLSYAPVLSLHDPDGQVPLNLLRTEIIGGIDTLAPSLQANLFLDVLAYCLVRAPGGVERCSPESLNGHPGMRWGYSSGLFPHGTTAYSNAGVMLADLELLTTQRLQDLVDPGLLSAGVDLSGGQCVVPVSGYARINEPEEFVDHEYEDLRANSNFSAPDILGLPEGVRRGTPFRALVWFGPERNASLDVLRRTPLDRIDLGNNYSVLSTPGVSGKSAFDLDVIASTGRTLNPKMAFPVAVEWFLEAPTEPVTPKPGSFAAMWLEVVGSAFIPFDRDERMARLGRRDEIMPYIDAWERDLRDKT